MFSTGQTVLMEFLLIFFHAEAEKAAIVHPSNEVATCSTVRTAPIRMESNELQLLGETVGKNGGDKVKPIKPCPLRFKAPENSTCESEKKVTSKGNPGKQ